MEEKFVGKIALETSLDAIKKYIDKYVTRIAELEAEAAELRELLEAGGGGSSRKLTIASGLGLLYDGVVYTGSYTLTDDFNVNQAKIVVIDDEDDKIYSLNMVTNAIVRSDADQVSTTLDSDGIAAGTMTNGTNTSTDWAAVWTNGEITITNVPLANNISRKEAKGENDGTGRTIDGTARLVLYRGDTRIDNGGLYYISAKDGYAIKSIKFTVTNYSNTSTARSMLCAGQEITFSGSTVYTFEAPQLYVEKLPLMVSSSSNVGISITNLEYELVQLNDSDLVVHNATNSAVAPSTLDGEAVYYRIPTIASKDGLQIMVYDRRYNDNGDVGFTTGGISIVYKTRKNAGEWSEEHVLVDRSYTNGDLTYAYGDASIVIDESGRILITAVCGIEAYSSGTRSSHIRLAAIYSDVSTYNEADGSLTWDNPIDITDQFYTQLTSATSLFISSGIFCQSTRVKVGNYYRIYGGILTTQTPANTVYLIYSDDFGTTWTVKTTAAMTAGNESTIAEMQNGDLILSSRPNGDSSLGRLLNIFHFTSESNMSSMTGSWGTYASSPATVNGLANIVTSGSAARGSLTLVPTTKDGVAGRLAMVSMPFGEGRQDLGIKYKFIPNNDQPTDPSVLAKCWEGYYRIYSGAVQYSMIDVVNGKIAIVYEEGDGTNKSNIVYVEHTLEAITHNKYSISE